MNERKPLQMQPSRVLEKLREGKVATAFKVNLADARVVELAAQVSGVDAIWTDMEHIPNDLSTVEKQILAAKAYDVDMFVRVSRGSYSNLIRPLEAGAHGILIPHVMSLQDAQQLVYYTKFHPIGRRPLDGGNADGIYGNIAGEAYRTQANQQRYNMLQIEDPEPLPELEAIIALEGVDMVFFGPADFSQGIGVPGQMEHPKVIETRKRIGELAIKHGKVAATAGSVENLEDLIDEGYRFISLGADVRALSQFCRHIDDKLQEKQDVLTNPGVRR